VDMLFCVPVEIHREAPTERKPGATPGPGRWQLPGALTRRDSRPAAWGHAAYKTEL